MEKLKELFSKAQIKYVISVDDCHRVSDRPDDYAIKMNMAGNQENTLYFFASIGKEEHVEVIRDCSQGDLLDYIEAIFDELNEEELRMYVQTYMQAYQVESRAKAALSTLLEELKSASIIEEFCTFTTREEAQGYFNNIQDHFSVGPDKRVLWMIDKDLSQTGGSSDSGIELIKNFISVHKPNHIYALTSAQLAGISNDTFRKSISENLTENDTLLACVVDKHHITEKQYSQLSDQISNGFRQNYSATIIKELYSIFSSASKSANDTIEKFGDDTLHKVLFESGRAEGVSPIDVFQRLLLIIIREDIFVQISEKYDEVAKLVHDYAQLCDWCGVFHKDYPDYEVIRKARMSECYDTHINNRFLPVASGDIFKIGDAYFILIGQSCNLTIRESGERTALCATLARISKVDESHKKESSTYTLHYFSDNDVWSIDFNDCVNVDFSVLDLCSLNIAGKAELLDEYDLDNAKYRYTNAVFKKLKNTVDHNRELACQYNELADKYAQREISLTELCEAVRKIYKDNSTEVEIYFNGGICYNISRQSRLASDILDDILKRYAEYHSRKGLQHDFAKEYKATTYSVKYGINWARYGVDEDAVSKLLMPQFVFYQSGAYKSEELKKTIIAEFREHYSESVLKKFQLESTEQWKCDEKQKAIVGVGKDVPVQIGEEFFLDVLRPVKDGKCSYRIPTRKIAGLKNKKGGSFEMENGAKMSISGSNASFYFPEGVSHKFFHEDILQNPILFEIALSRCVTLNVSYEGHTPDEEN